MRETEERLQWQLCNYWLREGQQWWSCCTETPQGCEWSHCVKLTCVLDFVCSNVHSLEDMIVEMFR